MEMTPTLTELLLLIIEGKNYAQVIAKETGKSPAAAVMQLQKLEKLGWIYSKKEKLLNKTVFSINNEKVIAAVVMLCKTSIEEINDYFEIDEKGSKLILSTKPFAIAGIDREMIKEYNVFLDKVKLDAEIEGFIAGSILRYLNEIKAHGLCRRKDLDSLLIHFIYGLGRKKDIQRSIYGKLGLSKKSKEQLYCLFEIFERITYFHQKVDLAAMAEKGLNEILKP